MQVRPRRHEPQGSLDDRRTELRNDPLTVAVGKDGSALERQRPNLQDAVPCPAPSGSQRVLPQEGSEHSHRQHGPADCLGDLRVPTDDRDANFAACCVDLA